MELICKKEKEKDFTWKVYEDKEKNIILLTIEKGKIDKEEQQIKEFFNSTIGVMSISIDREQYKERLQNPKYKEIIIKFLWNYFNTMWNQYKTKVLELKESNLPDCYKKQNREKVLNNICLTILSSNLKRKEKATGYHYLTYEELKKIADKAIRRMRVEDEERVWDGTIYDWCPICRHKFREIEHPSYFIYICPMCYFTKGKVWKDEYKEKEYDELLSSYNEYWPIRLGRKDKGKMSKKWKKE